MTITEREQAELERMISSGRRVCTVGVVGGSGDDQFFVVNFLESHRHRTKVYACKEDIPDKDKKFLACIVDATDALRNHVIAYC